MNSSNDTVNRNTNSQANGFSVRCVRDLIWRKFMDLILKEEIGDITLKDVFLAYYQCRKNKKNKIDCLEFDIDYEQNLIRLWEEIKRGDYKISPSSIFIVDKPVKREICAAKFRDRIVHHLIVMKLEPLFEKEFIYDSYSCRKGRGTHFGINRINKFIRSCSDNYKKECYVLKLDIKGYFMSINRNVLLNKLHNFICEKYRENDIKKLIYLCGLVINNDVTKNCVFNSSFNKWADLPKSKSLFYSKENCGLAIGNYTSQIFSNFYLNQFDHFVKSTLKIKYYGRYVDDFVLISKDKEELINIIPKIKVYLKENLKLDLHPKKIYLQNINRGVEFLGVYLKPWRKYITPRIKNNFYLVINNINNYFMDNKVVYEDIVKIREKINSYLGILSHYNTYKLKIKCINALDPLFFKYFKISVGLDKVVIIMITHI